MSSQSSAADPQRNPILRATFPIPFAEVGAEHVAPALRYALAEAERAYEAVAAARPPYRYDDLLGRLDRTGAWLDRVVSTVSHLNAVRQDAAMREAWSEALPELTAFGARVASDPRVYRVLHAYSETEEAAALPPEKARHLRLTLDEMRRAGAGLDEAGRARVEAIKSELATWSNTFQNNVLDGVSAYALDVRDEGRLRGIPPSARERARQAAEEAGEEGWRFTLHQPSYLAVLDHADDRALRQEMYQAAQQRGTGEGRDNRAVVPRILALRRSLAELLGYQHWADLVTEDRMAGDGATAVRFERDTFARVEPHLRDEVRDLEAFARERLGIERLQPWDVRYAFERLRSERFDVEQEALRPWFPLDRVQSAAFELAYELYGLRIEQAWTDTAWHEDVDYFEVYREDGTWVGAFYTDWAPRPGKRDGAWLIGLQTGGPDGDGFEPHLAAMCGNLTPADGDRPALLTHGEARTVFHEFGHLLHHLSSTVEVRERAGTNVPWDFVEVPSHLMENWLYEAPSLHRIARHVDDGRPLDEEVIQRLRQARACGAAYHMARQLSFGTVDLALHIDFDPAGDEDPVAFGTRVMAPFQIRPDAVPEGFLPSFAHIFAGGYAAGYYGYMWSEMLEADAFDRFREAGLYDPEVGAAFRDQVLSRGNGAPPDALMRGFLGRDPNPDAMLARNLGAARQARRD
ncbi:MAG: M3 family metallopeptidase [Trueperaceae bacterium]|nr:M3 family metallopeptidase [Trueperaceae bacterium]